MKSFMKKHFHKLFQVSVVFLQLTQSFQEPFEVDGKYHFSSTKGSGICISSLNLYLFLL